jgi:hypothetical protein
MTKDVSIMMSNSYDAIFSKLSTCTKSITIGAEFDEGIVPGSIQTYLESDVSKIENQKYITLYPDIIAIKNFNLNILGGILATINSRPSITPQQKLFWIYVNYLTIHGYRKILSLSDYYKHVICGYFEFAKENPIPRISKYPLLNITKRVRTHDYAINDILTNKKSKWIAKGKNRINFIKSKYE